MMSARSALLLLLGLLLQEGSRADSHLECPEALPCCSASYGVEVEKDLKYGEASMQPFQNSTFELFLDIYRPVVNSSDPLPVVINIHGGFFAPFSAKDGVYGVEAEIQPWVQRGFLGVAPEYRRHGPQTDLATVEEIGFMLMHPVWDILAAVRWVVNNSAELNADPHNIVLYGCSAGGITAGNANILSLGSGNSNDLFDIPDNFTVAASMGGGHIDELAALSPFVSTKSAQDIVPQFLAHYINDSIVAYSESADTAAFLSGAGVANEFISFEGEGVNGHCPKPHEDPVLFNQMMAFTLSHMTVSQCTLPPETTTTTTSSTPSSTSTTTTGSQSVSSSTTMSTTNETTNTTTTPMDDSEVSAATRHHTAALVAILAAVFKFYSPSGSRT